MNLFFFTKKSSNKVNKTRLIFDQYQLNYSDYFLGMTIMSDKMTFENIDKCLKTIPMNENKDILESIRLKDLFDKYIMNYV